MQKIKTAIIPAGGFGTRFLPTTKSVPKEMFPLGSKPIILHVVEEVVECGIENIIFVVSHHKQAIESFFSANEMLEDYLVSVGKEEEVKNLKRISKLANFSFVYTKPPYGNGGALAAAQHLIEDEPFVFIWSDEIILTQGPSRLAQCLETFDQFGQSVISAVEIKDPQKRSRYGMAELANVEGAHDEVKRIVRLVEKPKAGDEPSAFATHGAYVLTPDILSFFKEHKIKEGNELFITDVLHDAIARGNVLARIINNAMYFDCGNPIEYLYSQIDYALKYAPYAKEVKERLQTYACKN